MPYFHLMNWFGGVLCLSSWTPGILRPWDKSGLYPPDNRRVAGLWAFLGTAAWSCPPPVPTPVFPVLSEPKAFPHLGLFWSWSAQWPLRKLWSFPVAFLAQRWRKEDGHGCEYGGGRQCASKKNFLREGKWEKTEQKREVKGKGRPREDKGGR